MTSAVLSTTPAQPASEDFNKSEVFFVPFVAPPTDDIDYVEEFTEEEDVDFFGDTDPSVIEPTPDLKAAREKHEAKVRRRQHCRMKASLSPRNRMLRDIAEQNARNTDNGGEIKKKPKLPRELKQQIRNGKVPSGLHAYHLTRYWKLLIKENKRRRRESKLQRVLAVA